MGFNPPSRQEPEVLGFPFSYSIHSIRFKKGDRFSRSPFLIMPFFFRVYACRMFQQTQAEKPQAWPAYFAGVMTSLPPMYGRSGAGMRTEPSSLRLFSRNAISMRGGATQVLLSVWAKYLLPSLPLTRMPRRRACASPRLEQLPTSKYFFWRGRPCLDVAALNFQVGQIAGAAFQRAHRNIQRTEEIDGVLPESVIPHHGILRLADDDHLLLLKLMDAVHAALFDAVRADFLAEAGRIAGQRLRQLLFGENGVDEFADHGMLGRADQVEILALDLIHHVLHLGKAHHAR